MNRLAKIQAISGLAFAVFLVLHLATTVSAVGGPASYDGTLASLRAIYRAHPIVEFLLIGVSAAVHLACAGLQILRRRKTPQPTPSLRLRVHRTSGYVLMLFIAGHVFATRVMPAMSEGPADFSYLAFSVLSWPVFINPYYYALGLAGAIHFGLGLGFAVSALSPRTDARRVSLAVAAIAAVLVFAGVTGIIRGAENSEPARFAEFRALYKRYMPFMPQP
jgi:succinate dehydrogenase/fumarate reductase cytochrome b subunit